MNVLDMSQTRWAQLSSETGRFRCLMDAQKEVFEATLDAEFMLRRLAEGREETPEEDRKAHYRDLADRLDRSLRLLGIRRDKQQETT